LQNEVDELSTDAANSDAAHNDTPQDADLPPSHIRRSLRPHNSGISYGVGFADAISGKRRRTRDNKIENRAQEGVDDLSSLGKDNGW
jgi:hypothetical protein